MRIAKDKIARLMRAAFDEARRGVRLGHGGPFGAVVIDGRGRVIGRGHNTVLRDGDPTCHAEINAIRDAARRRGAPHLDGCTVVASSEPCPMCLTTSYWARVAGIVYGVRKEVAASAGFDDAFIYQDLRRPPGRRRVRLVHAEAHEDEGKGIFEAWRASGGELY